MARKIFLPNYRPFGEFVKRKTRHRYFDKADIFIADGYYVFVPDNDNYEGSVKMLFDEHNHPVGKEQEQKMSAAQLKKYRRRPCYKMISLLHNDENGDFFLYTGMRIVPDNEHECPALNYAKFIFTLLPTGVSGCDIGCMPRYAYSANHMVCRH